MRYFFLKGFFTIICTFFIASFLTAQKSQQDTIHSLRYIKVGDSLRKQKLYLPAISKYNNALKDYTRAKAWERVAHCENEIAYAYFRKKDFKSFLAYNQRALNTSTQKIPYKNIEEATALNDLGWYERRQKNYAKALQYCSKAYAIGEQLNAAKKYPKRMIFFNSDLGRIYGKQGLYDKAESHYLRSLELSQNVYGSKYIETAISFSNLGLIKSNQELHPEALNYYTKALEIYRDDPVKNNIRMAKCYNGMAVIYSRFYQKNKALEYYKRALTNYSKLKRENNYQMGMVLTNIGSIYTDTENDDLAMEYFNKALHILNQKPNDIEDRLFRDKILGSVYHNFGDINFKKEQYKKAIINHTKALSLKKKSLGDAHYKVAWSYENIGNDYLNLKKYDMTYTYLQKALHLRKKVFSDHHPKVAQSFNTLGNLRQVQDKHQEALDYFDQALLANKLSQLNSDTATPNQIHPYLDHFTALQSLLEKGNTYKKWWSEEHNHMLLDKSIASYRQAIALVPQLRSNLGRKDQTQFSTHLKKLYSETIAALFQYNKVVPNPQLLEEAFQYAAESKASALRRSVTTSGLSTISGVPKTILELQKQLSLEQASLQSNLIEEQSRKKERDSSQVTVLQERLILLHQRYDSLAKNISENYPKYHELKYQQQSPSIANIQQQLSENQILIEYHSSDSVTYAFVVSKDALSTKELKTPELTNKVSLLRQAILDKNTAGYKELATELHQSLIAPLELLPTIDAMTIVPDGSLWHLNFDLLLTTKTKTNHPREFPYLLKDVAINYVNASYLMTNSSKNDGIVTPQECLAFSFSKTQEEVHKKSQALPLAVLRNAKDDLPGTRKEIAAISQIVEGNYYYNAAASEANFKTQASDYSIFHLALHGEIDQDNPDLSRLYFTASKDTIEDNILYAHELYAMELPAKLAVLSACNTGSGKINTGEGITSLGTAFRYAGTQSLLLTNWEISDQTTPPLMHDFYDHIKQGMSKSKALQQAKLKYLQEAPDAKLHPFYWGGFYLLGDNTPIVFKTDTSYWLWILSAVLLFASGLLMRKKRGIK